MTDVSIIIATYNLVDYICAAVDSALGQTYPSCEIIVVDDGSTDETSAALARYGDRIRCIRRENGGPAAARNTGFRASSAPFVLFLDGDDRLMAEKVEEDMRVFAAAPDIGVAYCAWRSITEDGVLLGETCPARSGLLRREILTRKVGLPSPGVASIRRSAIESVGGFDESFRGTKDLLLWFRLADSGCAFGYVDRVLFEYRVRAGSLSNDPAASGDCTEIDVARRFFDRVDVSDEAQQLRPEALGRLHFEVGLRNARRGHLETAGDQIGKAVEMFPLILDEHDAILEEIAASALSPASRFRGTEFIDRLLASLPDRAGSLRAQRRRAYGRYHGAEAFLAHARGRTGSACPHLFPAVFGEPAFLLNRGFWRICGECIGVLPARRREEVRNVPN